MNGVMSGAPTPKSAPLVVLDVRDLHTRIDALAGLVRPLDGVDLQIRRGETFAIVGE